MATKRKPYVRIARSVLHEPWSREVKLAHELLQCYMADRWATDQLTAAEACVATISKADLFNITGKFRLSSARKLIVNLSNCVSLTVEFDGDYTTINWPKLAEYQGWDARERGEAGAREAPSPDQSAPAPSPAPEEAQEVGQKRAASPPPAPEPALDLVPSETQLRVEALDPAQLVNLLSKHPGEQQAKVDWLDEHLELMVYEVAKQGLETKDQNRAALRTLIIRWYRQHLKNPTGGEHRSWGEKDAESIKRQLGIADG